MATKSCGIERWCFQHVEHMAAFWNTPDGLDLFVRIEDVAISALKNTFACSDYRKYCGWYL